MQYQRVLLSQGFGGCLVKISGGPGWTGLLTLPGFTLGIPACTAQFFFREIPWSPNPCELKAKTPGSWRQQDVCWAFWSIWCILDVSFELMQIFQDCVFRVAVWALLDLWALRAPYVSFRSGLVGIVGGKRRELKCTDPFLEEWSGWEKRGCGTAGSSWSEGKDPRIGSKSCGTKLEKGRG